MMAPGSGRSIVGVACSHNHVCNRSGVIQSAGRLSAEKRRIPYSNGSAVSFDVGDDDLPLEVVVAKQLLLVIALIKLIRTIV
jgi:hypothetical protein